MCLRPWPGMRGEKHRCSITPRRMHSCLVYTHAASQYAASTHLSPYRRRMCNSNISTLPVSRCNIHIGPRRSINPAPFHQSCKITVFFFGAGVLDTNPAKIHHFPSVPTIPPFFHQIDAPAQEFLLFITETAKNTALLQLSPLIAPNRPHTRLSSRNLSLFLPHTTHAPSLLPTTHVPAYVPSLPYSIPCPQRLPRPPPATAAQPQLTFRNSPNAA